MRILPVSLPIASFHILLAFHSHVLDLQSSLPRQKQYRSGSDIVSPPLGEKTSCHALAAALEYCIQDAEIPVVH